MLVECRVLGNTHFGFAPLEKKGMEMLPPLLHSSWPTPIKMWQASPALHPSLEMHDRSVLQSSSQTVCSHHAVVQNNAKVIARNQVSDFYWNSNNIDVDQHRCGKPAICSHFPRETICVDLPQGIYHQCCSLYFPEAWPQHSCLGCFSSVQSPLSFRCTGWLIGILVMDDWHWWLSQISWIA